MDLDGLAALMSGANFLELEQLVSPPAWYRDGLCREYPGVTWFPGHGQSTAPAKAVCAQCLVRPECLAFALEQGSMFPGVWGGTSIAERRAALSAGYDAEYVIRTMGPMGPTVSATADIPKENEAPAAVLPTTVDIPEPPPRRRRIKYGDAVAWVDGELQAVPDPVSDEPPLDADVDAVLAWITRARRRR